MLKYDHIATNSLNNSYKKTPEPSPPKIHPQKRPDQPVGRENERDAELVPGEDLGTGNIF